MQLEWTQIAAGLVLVSTDTRTWVHRPALCPGADPFAEAMTGRGYVATTRRLLDGAVGLSQRAAAAREPGLPLTLTKYAERLVAHYYTTHWSAWQLRRAASRFQEGSRPELAELAERLARHEQCHDLLAVRDLEALGYPSEYASRSPMEPQTAALLHFALRCLAGSHPVTIFGYGYALLRAAGAVTPDYLHAVQSLLPPGVNATRCLRAHSALAGSSEYLNGLIEATACLPAEDRTRVIGAAYETTRIMFAPEVIPRPRSAPLASRPRTPRAKQLPTCEDAEEAIVLVAC